MPDIREEFESIYPLPEGMVRDGDSYSGSQFWWLWKDRWDAWQASRAALKVELPDALVPENNVSSKLIIGAYNALLEHVKEALQQAGIEVKHG